MTSLFNSNPALLDADRYFTETIAPIANALDDQPDRLRSALQGLGDRRLLGLRIPVIWGGADLDTLSFHAFQEQAARFSGALAFLQTQHQSAGAMLAKSENEALKQKYLPDLSSGKKLVGIGFSHLRRSNSPLKAIAVQNGFRLHGHIPWITGFDLFQSVLVAALLPDGQAVYGMIPFSDIEQTGGTIRFSEPMALAAMSSTNTVTATLTNWLLPASEVAFIAPAQAIHQSDRANVLNHSFFALGCAQAGLDSLATSADVKPFLTIAPATEALQREVKACRDRCYSTEAQSFEARLKLRTWSIELAVRCAHAAITAASGAANSSTHPAQRIYREALVWSVSGQTTAVLEATLDRIAQRSG